MTLFPKRSLRLITLFNNALTEEPTKITFTYARIPTLDQVEALKTAYPDAIHRQEKKSGTTAKGREVLELLFDMIGQGDKLVVWKLDTGLIKS